MPCFARVSGIMVMCSEITDCGELVQNGAYCYYLLVVKLVVIGNGLLLRVFNYFLIVGIFVPFTFTPSMVAPNSKAPPTIGTPYLIIPFRKSLFSVSFAEILSATNIIFSVISSRSSFRKCPLFSKVHLNLEESLYMLLQHLSDLNYYP